MALKDLLTEIEQLSVQEQLTLMEALSRQIRLSMQKSDYRSLRGILADAAVSADQDALKDDYAAFLEEKYR